MMALKRLMGIISKEQAEVREVAADATILPHTRDTKVPISTGLVEDWYPESSAKYGPTVRVWRRARRDGDQWTDGGESKGCTTDDLARTRRAAAGQHATARCLLKSDT